MKPQKEDSVIMQILSSIAVGFVTEPNKTQPTHYKLVAIDGPLHMRWPDGRWFEVTVKEIENELDTNN